MLEATGAPSVDEDSPEKYVDDCKLILRILKKPFHLISLRTRYCVRVAPFAHIEALTGIPGRRTGLIEEF